MIIVMRPDSTEADVELVVQRLGERGYGHHISRGEARTIIGAIGAPDHEKEVVAGQLSVLPGVERVVPILKPYKLISREYHPQPVAVRVGSARVGRRAGGDGRSCSVESREQIIQTARGQRQGQRRCAEAPTRAPRPSASRARSGAGYSWPRAETGLPSSPRSWTCASSRGGGGRGLCRSARVTCELRSA